MWRDAKAGLKRAFPRLIPVVRQCREVAERAHRSVEEAAFYGSGGWVGMKRLRPGMRVRVHPTAWRRSYSAFSPRGYCAEELDVFLSYCSPGMRFVDATGE